jgi:GPI ethanolamine phosphate transferase 3 subunit O
VLQEHPNDGRYRGQIRHYHNALRVLYETAVDQPGRAFLLPFISDPPTVTLQRLKGLTTGTLPTFVDAGSNFAGTAIDEDNLVAQLVAAGKNVVHLGDDTWHQLFPGYFDANLTRPYDSFNVWDLHTVDNGVIEHLFPLLEPQNATRWDVIFAHFLGVDHAGHRYGPDHPAMTAKLQQMDGVFRQLIDHLDDDTLLIVLGDHGMDAKGDHGGETDDEIEAALWMYSRKPAFGRVCISEKDGSEEFCADKPPAVAKDRFAIPQIDLVPTLALLLGIPIPFNNLGSPIREAFIGPSNNDFKALGSAFRITSGQIAQYQSEYGQVRGAEGAASDRSMSLLKDASEAWNSAKSSKAAASKGWKDLFIRNMWYQRDSLKMYRSVWQRFDITSMILGVQILLMALIVLVTYARGLEGDRIELTPVLLTRGGIGMIIGAGLGAVLNLFVPILPPITSFAYCTALGSIIGLYAAFWYLRHRLQWPFKNSIWNWACLVFPVALSGGFAANSFTIWEDEILLFFLASLGALTLVASFRQSNSLDRATGISHSIAFIALARLASFSRLCREEQMPYCKSTYYASATSSTSALWQLGIPLAVALLLPLVIKAHYNQTRSYQHSAQVWIGVALRLGLMFVALFWTLDSADDGDWFGKDVKWLKLLRVGIAQLIFAITFGAGFSTYAWAAPLLNIETRSNTKKEPNDAISPTQTIAQDKSSSITILGYANVHGSRYFLLFTIWLLAIILVEKPMGIGAIGILAWQILCLLEIIDANKLSDTAFGPVVLGLLGSYHFFKTGHQATLSSIQWETAFIASFTIRYPWSPILVIMNTFGAQILCAVAVPATILWKQPPKKKGLLGDAAKAMATHLLFYATIQLATTMWAGHLRRHLMLYRIFNPRFLMGAIVLVIVDIFGILVALGGTRWSFLSVAEVFGW